MSRFSSASIPQGSGLETDTKKTEGLSDFSVLGGPLHKLGRRVGLVRGETNTVPLGLVLGGLLWLVALFLVVTEGTVGSFFALSTIAAHVRLLVAIPLLFICEAWIDPRFSAFVESIARSGVVPTSALPQLESEIQRTTKWKDHWLPEALCLIAAGLGSLLASQLPLSGLTAVVGPSLAEGQGSWAGLWYRMVCLLVFRFLVFRWVWRLCLWWHFLWQLSKLDLHLIPTHPDRVAGLGELETVHIHFAPFVLAMSMVYSASFAQEISDGVTTLERIYPAIGLILSVDALLFLGPLFIFGRKLWACWVKGSREYRVFAAHYVNDFDRKWLRSTESPLGTPDLQSLADLGQSVDIVQSMRTAPVGTRLLVILGVAAVLPMLPLLLLKYPITELAQRIFQVVLGL